MQQSKKVLSLKRVQSEKTEANHRKNQLIQMILKEKETLKKLEQLILDKDSKIKKIVQSNQRNIKRQLRRKARLQQLKKCRDNPQLLLAYSGIMNEYVQAFMLSHNFQMNVDVTNMNPDSMSYQQLLELGQKIGKVSKGLTKEQIQTLDHLKVRKRQDNCPICCTEFQMSSIAIVLKCKHLYHEECIAEWFKDQNTCPMCKQSVLTDKIE